MHSADRAPLRGLTVSGVTAGYGGRAALHDVDLEARAGEVTGLIGPNGSGKTTLIRVASRGLPPWSGTVRIGEADPYAMQARNAARLVAVVPQDVLPAFSFSVLEMVLMGRSPHLSPWGVGGPRDWMVAREAMGATGIQHLADRPVMELSGGERQRVILAQALAQETPVLLLDEPTTHLDVRHMIDVLTLIRGLAWSEGRTVVATLHDLNLAGAYCDRIAVLFEGRIAAVGSPGAVITKQLLADVFGVEADVMDHAGSGRPSVILPSPEPASAPRGGSSHPGW